MLAIAGSELDITQKGCSIYVTIRCLLYAKEMTFQGKGWLDFNSLDLTNGLARADTEDDVSRTRTSGSKGEPMATAAEAGAKDTSSNGY